jgi:hypothetical protein
MNCFRADGHWFDLTRADAVCVGSWIDFEPTESAVMASTRCKQVECLGYAYLAYHYRLSGLNGGMTQVRTL